MDFNLKHWRDHCSEDHQQEGEDRQVAHAPAANLPKLLLQQQAGAAALPLFVPEPTSCNLSAYPSDTSTTPTATKFNNTLRCSLFSLSNSNNNNSAAGDSAVFLKSIFYDCLFWACLVAFLFCGFCFKCAKMADAEGMASCGGHFSLAQWQELELQALIFRHMIAGSDVPQELLHLVKNSLIASSSSSSSPFYFSHAFNHNFPNYQPAALLQSGYWGRAAMDPEPGRCRRTDGKKWRCSRDVVVGQKYCERHVHRGRNRSRKPVEVPTPASVAAAPYGGKPGGNGQVLKTNNTIITQGIMAGGDTPHFTLSGHSPSLDLLHRNQRNSETRDPLAHSRNDDHQGGLTLRHFFDGWPRSLDHETMNAAVSSVAAAASATNLSMSISGNTASDFSLKLSTGSGDASTNQLGGAERNRPQPGRDGAWEAANLVAPLGGPLAEALRSSTANSSPTSVLHRLQRGSVSEASFVST